MAYATADFEAQIALIITAIADEDRSAAYKAFATAKAIHAALTLVASKTDAGTTIQRSQSLSDLNDSLLTAFQVVSEAAGSGGGGTENFFTAPALGDA